MFFKITNTDTGIAYSLEEMENFCTTMGLNIVPILERNVTPLSSAKEMLEDSEGMSVINPKVKREGIVWCSMIDANVGCKAKSVKYAIWFAKKFDKTV